MMVMFDFNVLISVEMAIVDPNVGAFACLISDPATLSLGQSDCSCFASVLKGLTKLFPIKLIITLSGSAESYKGDDEKFLKHLLCLSKIFIINYNLDLIY